MVRVVRVIHKDGRTGTYTHCDSRGNWIVDFGDYCDAVPYTEFRPLGPVEDELLRCAGRMGPNGEDRGILYGLHKRNRYRWKQFCETWSSTMNDGEAVSEALEACARIYEQHGVAL